MRGHTMITVAEFDRLEEEEFRYELDEGELLTLTRPGVVHGRIERRLIVALQTYLDAHPVGEVFGSDVLFVLGAATKRAPDVSVLLRPAGDGKEILGAPEIAIEILSASNRPISMRRKIGQFFAAGCKLAWIVDPDRRTIEIWKSASAPDRTLTESDTLDAQELLPGFSIAVRGIF